LKINIITESEVSVFHCKSCNEFFSINTYIPFDNEGMYNIPNTKNIHCPVCGKQETEPMNCRNFEEYNVKHGICPSCGEKLKPIEPFEINSRQTQLIKVIRCSKCDYEKQLFISVDPNDDIIDFNFREKKI
jgi:RNase P subunit RPR2